MSGCSCGEPVIFNQPTPPRVLDVETEILCDVLPDGTIAGTVMLEPVYSQSDGTRVGTRIVDPATGATYTPQGTLGVCTPSCMECDSRVLCDTFLEGGTPGEAPERVTNGGFAGGSGTGWTVTYANPTGAGGGPVANGNDFNGDGGFFDFSGGNAENPTTVEQTVTVTPGLAYNLSARFGVWNAGGDDPVIGRAQVIDGNGNILFSQDYGPLPQAGSQVSWPSEGTITAGPLSTTSTTMRLVFTDLGILQPDPEGDGGQFQTDLLLDAVSLLGPGVPPDPGTPTTHKFLRTECRNCQGDIVRTIDTELDGATAYVVQGAVGDCPDSPSVFQHQEVLCDTAATGEPVQFIRKYVQDAAGSVTDTVDFDLEGQPYTVVGTVGVCPDPAPCNDCETFRLCDTVITGGTEPEAPERVTNGEFVNGDITGWTKILANPVPPGDSGGGGVNSANGFNGSTGFFDFSGANRRNPTSIEQTVTVTPGVAYNLTGRFGVWNAGGNDPVSGRVQVFDGTGALLWSSDYPNLPQVGGAVTWPSEGAIASPSLSTTGTTMRLVFTDIGILAPGSDGQFQTDLVLDAVSLLGPGVPGTPGTPTVTPFLRTICRDCQGDIVGTIDTELDGTTAYVVQGTVGQCPVASSCNDCETTQLCDVQREVSAVLPAFGADGSSDVWHDLSNGVRWKRDGADGVLPGVWYVAGTTFPERFTFSKPVEIVYSVRFTSATAQPLVIPPGWDLDGLLVVQHDWDTATRTISPRAGVTPTGESTFRSRNFTWDMIAPSIRAAQPAGDRSDYGRITVTADVSTPFLRTVCRACDGTVNSVTDTTLDGQTAYTTVGTVGVCAPDPAPTTPCNDCEQQILCDDGADDPVTVTGTGASTGTLSNGVTWSMRGNSAAQNSNYDGGEGSWWPATWTFPNASIGPQNFTVDKPSVIEFSVYMNWVDFSGSTDPTVRNETQLPANVVPVYLPDGYHWNEATNVLTVDDTRAVANGEPCSNLTSPLVAESARFRTTEPVSGVTTRYRGVRVAQCVTFGSQRVGAYAVAGTGQFLRTICRGCDGVVTTVTDTTLDGRTAYTPAGSVKTCPQVVTGSVAVAGTVDTVPLVFQHQEILCDAPIPAVGEMVTNGTFATNVSGWTFFGGGTGNGYGPPDFGYAGPDGSAGVMAFNTGNRAPLGGIRQTIATQAGATYQFKARVGARSTTGDDGSPMRLLVEVVSAAGAVLFSRTVAPTYTVGSGLAWPADGAVDVPVTAVDSSLTLRFTDVSTGPAAGVDLLLDDVSLIQTGPGTPIPFIRKYIQDAAGAVVDTVDFDLEGQLYDVVGAVGVCARTEDCCQPVPVCVQQVTSDTVHLVTNQARLQDQSEDPVWTWRLESGNPDFWFPMYRGTKNAAWTLADPYNPSDPTDPLRADWSTPHPNGSTENNGPADPGPSIGGTNAAPSYWIARAQFTLPDTALAHTIRLAASAINADASAVQFRLNDGPWQSTGNNTPAAVGNYQAPAFRIDPEQYIPGAQPGVNTLYVRVKENVTGPSAGLLAHVWATFDTPVPGTMQSWVEMVCCDGTSYFLEDRGATGNVRHEDLPGDFRIVPCVAGSGEGTALDTEQQLLCSVAGGDTPTTVTTTAPDVLDWTIQAGTNVTKSSNMRDPDAFFRFSTDQTPPNGVVTVQVGGLTPNGQYQWVPRIQHFGFEGAGTFQVLDGATVLDGNTVNHNTFPNYPQGGAWQDVPDITFTAPVSGTVTLRIADATPPPANSRDLVAQPGTLVLTIPAGQTVTTPFLRHTVYGPDGNAVRVYDTELDGVTPFDPGLNVGVCSSDGGGSGPERDRITVPLCDFGANGAVTGFLRHWTVDNSTGAITAANPPNTGLDGVTPYTPGASVGICGSQQADQPVLPLLARITSGTWSIAGQGGPGTQSVTVTVLAGTASVTGAVGGAVVVPAGVTLTWSVSDTDDSSLSALSVAPGASSDVLINWTRKATLSG